MTEKRQGLTSGVRLREMTVKTELTITLSADLKWNGGINETIKKANKRLYFSVLLKTAGMSCKDIVTFYCTVIRRYQNLLTHIPP